MKSWKILVASALAIGLAASLGGCAGGGNYYADAPAPNHPFAKSALSDEVFLDGTGPSARQAGRRVRYQDDAPATMTPERVAAHSRPLAIETDERSDAVSGSTGARSQGPNQAQNQRKNQGPPPRQNQAQNDPNKPFSDAWWERERAEDARLKAKMNICRGC